MENFLQCVTKERALKEAWTKKVMHQDKQLFFNHDKATNVVQKRTERSSVGGDGEEQRWGGAQEEATARSREVAQLEEQLRGGSAQQKIVINAEEQHLHKQRLQQKEDKETHENKRFCLQECLL